MHFAAVGWLSGLVPLSGLIIWLLYRRPKPLPVPFLALWPDEARLRQRGALRRPPVAVLLLLLSILTAILSAASPRVRGDPWVKSKPAALVATQAEKISIFAAAVSPEQPGQVMVSLRNDGPPCTVDLSVDCDATAVEQPIVLPSTSKKNVFVDMPALTNQIELTVRTSGRSDPIDSAILLAKPSVPRIVTRGDLPQDVTRFLTIFAEKRKTISSAGATLICTDDPHEASAAWVPHCQEILEPTAVKVVPHAVTRQVDFSQLSTESVRCAALPPADWLAVVSSGSRPLVCVREVPARAVWIGFDSPSFSNHTDFVVFWANVMSWLGRERAAYEFHPSHEGVNGERSASAGNNSKAAELNLAPSLAALATAAAAAALLLTPQARSPKRLDR